MFLQDEKFRNLAIAAVMRRGCRDYILLVTFQNV